MTVESAFLRLPIELRLQIYDYCFISGGLTISGCMVPPWWPTDYNSKSGNIPGLARNRLPVAKLGFDRDVLEGHPDIKNFTWISSTTTKRDEGSCTADRDQTPPASIQTKTKAWMLPAPCSPSSESPLFLSPTLPYLHLTCRQIHSELETLRNLYSEPGSKTFRNLDLYLSYPEGVCALVHRYSHLLHQARAVFISGVCDLIIARSTIPNQPSVLRSGRTGADGRPTNKRSIDEEQADALSELVDRVYLIGQKSINASEIASDRAIVPGDQHVYDQRSQSNTSTRSFSSSSSSSSTQSDSSTTNPHVSTEILTIDPSPEPTVPSSQSTTPHPSLFLRIFYPTPSPRLIANPHRATWSHNLAPIGVALGGIQGGEIKLTVERGLPGTAVELVATGNQGRRRYVSYSSPDPNSTWANASAITEAQMWAWCIPLAWADGSSSNGNGEEDVEAAVGEMSLAGEGVGA